MLACAFILPSYLFAQVTPPLALDIELGAGQLTGRGVSKIYGPGIRAVAGPRIGLDDNDRLWVRVNGGVYWSFKQIEEENKVTDHLRIFKAGVQMQYALFKTQPALSLLAGADYNWCANYYSAVTRYDWYTRSYDIKRSDKFLRGNGISMEAGARLNFDNWYLKLAYEYYQPRLAVLEDLVMDMRSYGYSVPDTYTYNLSSINLCMGFQLNFAK